MKSYALNVLRRAFGAGDTIGVTHFGEPVLDLIALNEPGMPMSTVALPVPYPEMFTTDAAGRWLFASNSGALFDGADLVRPLSCGAAYSIVGADTGTTAIATAAGGILVFSLGSTLAVAGSVAGSHVVFAARDAPYKVVTEPR